MARPPRLRKKNGYWMNKAGGTETYFGKVDVAPFGMLAGCSSTAPEHGGRPP